MGLYAAKVLISAVVIVAVTELSKRGGTFWGGILASLPLVSILSFLWIYAETKDSGKIADLSWSILWLVIPSLVLFAALPFLIKRGAGFHAALGGAVLMMAGAYLFAAAVARRLGMTL